MDWCEEPRCDNMVRFLLQVEADNGKHFELELCAQHAIEWCADLEKMRIGIDPSFLVNLTELPL